VSAAEIVAEPPAQIVPPPLTVAVGEGLTVTVALPDEVPVQFVSETEVTVLVVIPLWGTPSDHMMLHGGVPVSAAEMVAEPPVQMLASPLTVAVGSGVTVTVTSSVSVNELASVTVSV